MESAPRRLQNKQEVNFLCDIIKHLLSVKEAFVDLQIVVTLGVSTWSCERRAGWHGDNIDEIA